MRHINKYWVEFTLIFLCLPALIALYPSRTIVHAPVWIGAVLALRWLHKQPDFSWKTLWHGTEWNTKLRNKALLRFLVLSIPLTGLSYVLLPDRFFSFPAERPWFWLMVMLLYPLLSVIPQEILFRSFFFQRYHHLFPSRQAFLVTNGLLFGLAHIVFHNPVSPILCAIGGIMFAINYDRHRSLKWVVIEHALYGCLIFTVGLGKFFFVNPSIRV